MKVLYATRHISDTKLPGFFIDFLIFCIGELPDDLPEMSEDEDEDYEDDENSPEATMAGTV